MISISDKKSHPVQNKEKCAAALFLPLFEGIRSATLISTIIQTAILSQRRQGVPRRPLMTWRANVLPSTGTEIWTAGSPSVRMTEPLSPARFPDAGGASWTETARIKIDDLCWHRTLYVCENAGGRTNFQHQSRRLVVLKRQFFWFMGLKENRKCNLGGGRAKEMI